MRSTRLDAAYDGLTAREMTCVRGRAGAWPSCLSLTELARHALRLTISCNEPACVTAWLPHTLLSGTAPWRLPWNLYGEPCPPARGRTLALAIMG